MKLTESQELFIQVGRIENLLMAMTIGDIPRQDEEYKKYLKKRRYLLRKAKTAYNKEMKKHETN